MARNTLAGTRKGTSKTAKYYQSNPEARKKKIEYDKKYQKSRVGYREELNAANRKAKTYGNKDGKDMSHKKNGKIIMEKQSLNRKRNGSNGKSTKK